MQVQEWEKLWKTSETRSSRYLEKRVVFTILEIILEKLYFRVASTSELRY